MFKRLFSRKESLPKSIYDRVVSNSGKTVQFTGTIPFKPNGMLQLSTQLKSDQYQIQIVRHEHETMIIQAELEKFLADESCSFSEETAYDDKVYLSLTWLNKPWWIQSYTEICKGEEFFEIVNDKKTQQIKYIPRQSLEKIRKLKHTIINSDLDSFLSECRQFSKNPIENIRCIKEQKIRNHNRTSVALRRPGKYVITIPNSTYVELGNGFESVSNFDDQSAQLINHVQKSEIKNPLIVSDNGYVRIRDITNKGSTFNIKFHSSHEILINQDNNILCGLHQGNNRVDLTFSKVGQYTIILPESCDVIVNSHEATINYSSNRRTRFNVKCAELNGIYVDSGSISYHNIDGRCYRFGYSYNDPETNIETPKGIINVY